jgi:flagellar basal-body rod protein FlgB
VGLIDGTQLVLEQAMAGSAARQQVLANNIANANTPNFKRSDLDFQSQLISALQAGGPSAVENLAYSPKVDTESPVQANGNNVNVDTEMAAMSQNAIDYQSLVEIAAARMKMLQSAIGSVVS